MKKCIVIFIWLLNSIATSSQTVNYADHEGAEDSRNIIGINNKVYYLVKTKPVPGCCSDHISVVGIDANGSQFFRTTTTIQPHLNYYNLISTADKRLIVYGGTRMRGCDYGGWRFTTSMIDTNGVVLWNFTNSRIIENIFPRFDGSFDMLTADSLLHFDLNGLLIKKAIHGTNNVINSSTLLQNGSILINYGSAPNIRFRIIDTNATVVFDQTTAFATQCFAECSNGTKFAISSNFLVKYDSVLNVVATSQSLLSPSVSLSSLFCRNDSVFVVGTDIQGHPLYVIFNSNLINLHQSTSNIVAPYKSTGVCVDKGNVNILTTGFGTHAFAAYFKLPLLGNFIATHDIGVTDVKIIWDSIYYWTMYPNTLKIFNGLIIANAKVRNYGTDTIFSLSLNFYSTRFASWTTCQNGLNKIFSVVIPPGAEITVNTGTFGIQQFNQHALSPEGSVDLSICIRSAIPNYQCDIDFTNDQSCYNFLLQTTVGIKEEHFSFQNLKIFPNPSNDFINISNDRIISSIQVFDMKGRLIKDYEGNNSEINLDVRNYNKGLYVFKINCDDVTAVRKVMVN